MRFNRFITTLLAAYVTSLTALAVPWRYTEENGPARWGEISKAYAMCQIGMNQSPIDIQTTTASKLGLPALNMQYADDLTRFRNISHTLQATMGSYTSNSVKIDETLHYLKQFDFYALSKHTLNGKTYPLEVQLLHKNQSEDIAIVVATLDVGGQNQTIQSLWESFPTMKDSSMDIFSPVGIHQPLPDNKTYWRYRGSLIIPPCTEGVTWLILKTPVALSTKQLDKSRYIVGPVSNRLLQPLNKRKITDGYSGGTKILY